MAAPEDCTSCKEGTTFAPAYIGGRLATVSSNEVEQESKADYDKNVLEDMNFKNIIFEVKKRPKRQYFILGRYTTLSAGIRG